MRRENPSALHVPAAEDPLDSPTIKRVQAERLGCRTIGHTAQFGRNNRRPPIPLTIRTWNATCLQPWGGLCGELFHPHRGWESSHRWERYPIASLVTIRVAGLPMCGLRARPNALCLDVLFCLPNSLPPAAVVPAVGQEDQCRSRRGCPDRDSCSSRAVPHAIAPGKAAVMSLSRRERGRQRNIPRW